MVNFNIFRNPFIYQRSAYLFENHWREIISQDIQKFGAKIESNMPNTSEEIHHGEELLKSWAKYIIHECSNIAKKGGS